MNLEQQGELLRTKWQTDNVYNAVCCKTCSYSRSIGSSMLFGCEKMSQDINRPFAKCIVLAWSVCSFFKTKME